jgi:hypothetical protein
MKQLTNHWRIHNSKRIKDFVVSIVAKVAVSDVNETTLVER